MATFGTGHAMEAANISRDECRGHSGTVNGLCLLAAGVLVGGAALAISLYARHDKLPGNNTDLIMGQAEENPRSLGCFADEEYSRVMPYRNKDEALTPSVSGENDRTLR